MTSTTHPDFGATTEGLDVAKAFAGNVRGKTVLVTGGNIKGIGYTTAEGFASQGAAHVIIAGRTASKLQECVDALRANYPDVDYRVLVLDLSSQKAVRKAAAELLSWTDVPKVDIVVNSAGVMNLPELTINEDGLEMQFATNHVGHYLFTCLIMPKLIKASEGAPKGATRVVNVTSMSPTWAAIRWSDINYEKVNKTLPEAEQPAYEVHKRWGEKDPENGSYLPLEGYNQSKVGNVLFSIGLNKRLYEKHGILSIAVHPGVIVTELSRSAKQETMDAIREFIKAGRVTFRSLGAGAATSLVAALDPKLVNPTETRDGKENYGVFMLDCQISNDARPLAVSSEQAEKLWDLSETLVKEKFSW